MGHGIQQNDRGVLAKQAWHRHPNFKVLGRKLKLTDLSEAFGWDAEEAPVYVKVGGKYVLVEGKKGIVRSDTSEALAVVGQNYHANQYGETFEAIAQVGIDNGCDLLTAGTLGNGRKAFLSMQLPAGTEFEFDGWSVAKPMLNFGDSYDGTSTLRGTNVVGAVVCQNTFNANILGVPAIFKIRHSSGAKVVIAQTLARLDESIKQAVEIKAAVERLTNEAFTESAFEELLASNGMLKARPDDEGFAQTMWDKRHDGDHGPLPSRRRGEHSGHEDGRPHGHPRLRAARAPHVGRDQPGRPAR